MIEIYPHELSSPIEFLVEAYNAHNCVAIGETHCQRTLHKLVAELIPQLKEKAGLECLCLGLDVSIQEILERYCEIGESADLADINRNLKMLTQKYHHRYEGRQTDEYFQIIENARSCGVKIIDIKPDTKFMLEVGMKDSSKVDEFMAKKIPVNKSSLVYIGELHVRRDIGIPKYRNIYPISAVKNPLTEPDIMQVTPGWLEMLCKENPWLVQPFAFDLRKDNLGKYLVSNTLKLEIPDYTMWFDGILVY